MLERKISGETLITKQTEITIYSEELKLTFSAAGHGALEGARDRLPGLLLSGSLFQRHTVHQLTGGRGHLNSNERCHVTHIHEQSKEQRMEKTNYMPAKIVTELKAAARLSVCVSKQRHGQQSSFLFNFCKSSNCCCLSGFECFNFEHLTATALK